MLESNDGEDLKDEDARIYYGSGAISAHNKRI